ncbi:uncharacterized protein V1516DRAFT_28338 [Lipomyces oligophaga]|uniref:uncharacterized protein n=1 Tax=Lipomyces oligophaga TaxID=45792 RepID=UPI0034CEDD6A
MTRAKLDKRIRLFPRLALLITLLLNCRHCCPPYSPYCPYCPVYEPTYIVVPRRIVILHSSPPFLSPCKLYGRSTYA